MKSTFEEKLKEIAFKKSIAYCMGCGIDVHAEHCPKCGSDDFARHLKGVGVDWGHDWIVKHILSENLSEAELDEAFESHISDLYPEETEIGWMRVNTIEAMKEVDPTWWTMEKDNYISELEENEEVISFDNGIHYYWPHDLEKFIEEELD